MKKQAKWMTKHTDMNNQHTKLKHAQLANRTSKNAYVAHYKTNNLK